MERWGSCIEEEEEEEVGVSGGLESEMGKESSSRRRCGRRVLK